MIWRIVILSLFAAIRCAAQVVDGEDLVRAALADTMVYDVLPTGSMVPAFDETDWLCVRAAPWADVKVGDTILYLSRTRFDADHRLLLIVHSVIRLSSNHSVAICKGFANERPDDELIVESMYRGTVVGIVKKPRSARDTPATSP